MTKFKKALGRAEDSVVIWISSLIRHSSFVITVPPSLDTREHDETQFI